MAPVVRCKFGAPIFEPKVFRKQMYCIEESIWNIIGTFRCSRSQARRQDLAAGGAKNQKEGPKTRRGGHIFKILYWMYAATRRPTVKWGGTYFKWGGRVPLAPRWRRPCPQSFGARRSDSAPGELCPFDPSFVTPLFRYDCFEGFYYKGR